MPRRNLLPTLILTASTAALLTPGQAPAQPGAGSPPLGRPGQAESRGDEGVRGGNASGPSQPSQPGQPGTPGTGGGAGDAGGAGGASGGTDAGAAVPKRTAPPL